MAAMEEVMGVGMAEVKASPAASSNSSKSDSRSSAINSKSTTAPGQSQKGQNLKSSGNKVLKNLSEKQISVVKEKLEQKRNEVEKKNFTDTGKHWAKANIDKVQSLGLIVVTGTAVSSLMPQ